MRNKSISVNAVLFMIRNIMKILFPLITFPYISRVLGVKNIGSYNFANSIINYFLLISELGISTYAVREGARLRENKVKIESFINEVFTINIISTIISYMLLILTLALFIDIRTYTLLITVLSTKIIFNTIGLEWVYTIYEEFAYIVVRSITVQVLSIIMMFLFVKTPNDVYIYSGITVLASVGSNLFNWVQSKKYCKVKIVRDINLKKHIKPILLIFFTTISISIYSTADITMLGILSGDKAVGLYSVSAKIYDISKSTLAAIILVSIPRLSAILGEKKYNQYNIIAQKVYKTLISLTIPTMFGILLLAPDIIILISGNEFIEATFSLKVLSIAAIMNLGAWFYGQCVLIPLKKEKIMLFMSIITALTNVFLNIFMIPVWAENATAMTTLISEFLSLVIVMITSRKYIKFNKIYISYIKTALGCIGMAIGIHYILCLGLNMYLEIVSSIITGIFTYTIAEIILKNKEFIEIIQTLAFKVVNILNNLKKSDSHTNVR